MKTANTSQVVEVVEVATAFRALSTGFETSNRCLAPSSDNCATYAHYDVESPSHASDLTLR